MIPRLKFLRVWWLVATAAFPMASASSGVPLRVAGVFGDHAVLQQGVPVPVWGWAQPGQEVRVNFGGQDKAAVGNEKGEWMLRLGPMEASGDGRKLTVTAGEEVQVFRDVVVGEVWLASGQSNMQFSLDACARRLAEVKAAVDDPEECGIRMLRIGSGDQEGAVEDIDRQRNHWRVDGPDVRGGQSAVAFFFAQRLWEELKVPIGIIETSWGGKPIEGFIPREAYSRHEALRPILPLADGNRLEELKKLEGGVFVRNTAGLPGRIFNARLAPVAPFAVRGAIWYQGESNAGVDEDPRNYRHKMRALIEGWRRAWKQPDMPVYFVQLPAFSDEAFGWVRLREEQRLSLEVPNTGMAVTIDLRDADIHPANKIDVGERLSVWALNRDYGREEVVPSGPLFKSADIQGETVRVQFNHVGNGLMIARKEGLAAPVEDAEIRQVEHFELANKSGTWHTGTAVIEGQEVVVKSKAVTNPVAVRYACRGAPPNANLYNRAGLPASPFCSRLEFLPWAAPEAEKPE